MCWYTKYFEDQGQLQLYKRETKKRFDGLISDLENCEAEAITRMLEKLKKNIYSQPSNPKGFLFAMFKNILVDIHREKFGRPRTPLPMKREGPVISKIFQLFCLNKKNDDEISELLMIHKEIVRKWTSWLTVKNKCPSQPLLVSMDPVADDVNGFASRLYDVDEPDPTAQHIIDTEESAILTILKDLMQQSELGDELVVGEGGSSVIQKLREQVQLTDEQVILVSMRYVEGMTVSAAARELNLSRKVLEKQEQAVLSQLYQVFKTLGIEQ